ncbi:hypothetical protein Ddye_001462 [Dipteronia dyeriana]|uniref:RNase H type-1 domain-containing protein n=1 Tax=Dipteronia dyeriana TaxID=168575 RepID=A0AAD9XPX6_9ROSI|nr:hypothetical protein Ddye_001462 [Dipteronia dyeriana]
MKPTKKSVQNSWLPLVGYDLVFKVDSSMRGSSGSTSIGDVLRNVNGKFLCLFSLNVDTDRPVVAEILVIHKTCILISSCPFLAYRNISIMSDSNVAVSWINGMLSHVNLLYDIRQILLSRHSLAVTFTSRGANSLTDCLAKAGANLEGDRLEWSL